MADIKAILAATVFCIASTILDYAPFNCQLELAYVWRVSVSNVEHLYHFSKAALSTVATSTKFHWSRSLNIHVKMRAHQQIFVNFLLRFS
jgi:hypothetical protein